MDNITPCLWFDNNAEQAANFYVGIFPDSRIRQITHYPENTPERGGQVLTVSFELNGTAYLALNGGPQFSFNEAVSLMVNCADQSEIDYYWDKLLDGGSAMACGWLKDKYGLAWQIVPTTFFELVSSDQPERAARVLAAMNTMVKFDLAALEEAAAGNNQTS